MAETTGRSRPARSEEAPETEAAAKPAPAKRPSPAPKKAPAAKKAPAPKKTPAAAKKAAEKPATPSVADILYTVYLEDIDTGALTPVGDIASAKNIKPDMVLVNYLASLAPGDEHDTAVALADYAVEGPKGIDRITVSETRFYEFIAR